MQDLQDERANPQGECPVDIQASEPRSGWDGNRILQNPQYGQSNGWDGRP